MRCESFSCRIRFLLSQRLRTTFWERWVMSPPSSRIGGIVPTRTKIPSHAPVSSVAICFGKSGVGLIKRLLEIRSSSGDCSISANSRISDSERPCRICNAQSLARMDRHGKFWHSGRATGKGWFAIGSIRSTKPCLPSRTMVTLQNRTWHSRGCGR